MTNEQLAVLLNGYVERLRVAISEADDALGEGVEREVEWKYVGDAPACSTKRMCSYPAKDPEDWEAGKGDALALGPLLEVVEDIEADIESLSPG